MNYIAVVGPTNNVKVLDRRGKVKKEIPINSAKEVQSIEWDMDSDTISIVTVKLQSDIGRLFISLSLVRIY